MVKRTNVYNDFVSQKWSLAEVKKGKRKAQAVVTAVLEHCALTLYCYLPFSEYPFLLELHKEKG